MFLNKKLIFFGTSVTLLATLFFSTFFTSNQRRVNFIQGYGWRVEKTPFLCEEYKIPEFFSPQLEEYNEMQKISGFDFKKYRAKTVSRYSYKILNHPTDKNYTYANVFVYRGRIIAADIVSPQSEGFIAPINSYNDE